MLSRGGYRACHHQLPLQAHPRHPDAPFTDLGELLRAARKAMKRRCLVFVISDFISTPGWERELELLNRRHEVLAIRLRDPRESNLPDVGPLLVADAETGEQLYVDTGDRGFRRRFAEASARREAEIADVVREGGRRRARALDR